MAISLKLLLVCYAFLFLQSDVVSAQITPLYEVVSSELGFEITWSPEGDLIAAATRDGIKIYTPDLQEVATLIGHENSVISLAWKPDGTQLAAAGVLYDNIQIWDRDVGANTFSLLTTLSNQYSQKYANKIAWSPNGNNLAVLGDSPPEGSDAFIGTVELFDTTTWASSKRLKETFIWPSPVLEWTPDSKSIVIGENGCEPGDQHQICRDWPIIHVINVITEQLQISFELPWIFPPHALSWSQNGELAVATTPEVVVYDVESGEIKSTNEQGIPLTVDWNTRSGYLVIGGWGGLLTVQETSMGGNVFNIEPEISATYEDSIVSADWSPDGSVIATVTKSGTIQVWDMSNLPSTTGIPTVTPINE
jgi:WD40 repeat protein